MSGLVGGYRAIADIDYSLECPISLLPFKTPIILSDGHTFEMDAISEWFKSSAFRTNQGMALKSPVTGQVVRNVVTRNYAISYILEPWKEVKKLIAHQKAALEEADEYEHQTQAKVALLKVLLENRDEEIRTLKNQLTEVTQQAQLNMSEFEATRVELDDTKMQLQLLSQTLEELKSRKLPWAEWKKSKAANWMEKMCLIKA
ncbi:hypothetical protein HDU79_009697 [Rhizoclosmatium sp. JEL0117]|nr:hypothetical protein HDU79_009697 [Rhizoclosmatium sp. JEL0117]